MARKAKFIEILAPGRNLAYAKEAIKCGADAVYIGASKLSMRIEHGNTLDDLRKLVGYAHRYWVKIYVALNSLLFSDEEVEAARRLAFDLYGIGVDGIIVQDVGMLELDIPPIPIILSTQATSRFSPEEAAFFERCGVDKAVLPRELSLEEIRKIAAAAPGMTMEAFCYGILCVGYSGNCYFTYAENIGRGQSLDECRECASNHGTCYWRCMGNWRLEDGDGSVVVGSDRLFNLRFLNLVDRLGDMMDAGVEAFKISGREQDLQYLRNSTAMFSLAADEAAKRTGIPRASSGHAILGFVPDRHKNFNKGFTEFFLHGRKKEMYSRNDAVGQPVGRAEDLGAGWFSLDSSVPLAVGDRLRYKAGGKVCVVEITKAENGKYRGDRDDMIGRELYRHVNAAGFAEVENSINRRVIQLLVKAGSDKVRASDEDGNSVSIPYVKGGHKVDFLDLSDEDVEFMAAEGSDEVFAGGADDLRARLYAAMRAEREKNRPRRERAILKNDYPYYKEELDSHSNVVNDKAREFWTRHGVKKIEPGFETSADIKGKAAFRSKYCLKYELGFCPKEPDSETPPPEPWRLTQLESDDRFRVGCDCEKCEMRLYYEGTGSAEVRK